MLLLTFIYKFLCKHTFLIVLGIYIEVKFLGHMVTLFNFLRGCQIVFQNGYTILHSHWQCMRVPISPHIPQHLLLSVLLITAILVSMKWYLIVVLICIYLVTNDFAHLFMCSSAIFFLPFFDMTFRHVVFWYSIWHSLSFLFYSLVFVINFGKFPVIMTSNIS